MPAAAAAEVVLSSLPLPQPPDGDILALYNGGNWRAYMTDAFRTTMRIARPTGYLFHAGPRGILGTDPEHPDPHDPTELAAWIRRENPHATLHIGIGLDGWTSYLMAHLLPIVPGGVPHATAAAEATVVLMFEQIARLALSLGVIEIMGDTEDAAIRSPSAGKVMARLFLETFQRCAPSIVLTMTSYDDPVPVEYPHGSGHPWGGVSYRLPYSAWFGQLGLAAWFVKQNYDAAKRGFSTVIQAFWRRNASALSMAAAVALGWIDPRIPILLYLQVHNTIRYAIVSVAGNERRVYYWAVDTTVATGETMDAEGLAAMALLAKLRDRDCRGPGAIVRFLEETHTRDGDADFEFGPEAERALNLLSHGP